MEHAGVLSTSNDWTVGKPARSATDKFVKQLSLDFPLTDTGLDESQQPAESGLGDIAGLLDHVDFDRVLGHAELVHQGGVYARLAALQFTT